MMDNLSEKGHQEALALIESFKKQIKNIADQTIGNVYTEIMPYIESDSWLNYREHLRLEMQNKYLKKETLTTEEAWGKFIREAIFTQFREELEQGIIRDQQERIKTLEKWLDERRQF